MENMGNSKLEYDKLMASDFLDRSVVEHPQFYRSFTEEYDLMSDYGRIPATVEIKGDKVVLTAKQYLPNATNGIYKGYRSTGQRVLGIESYNDVDYFCVRKDECSTISFPDRGTQNLWRGRELKAYLGNEQLCKSSVSHHFEDHLGNIANLAIKIPELTISGGIQGSKPSFYEGEYKEGDLHCEVAGRQSGHGVVETYHFSRVGGKGGIRVEERGIGSVNLENPFSLENRGGDLVKYDGNGKLIYLASQFPTVELAKAAIENAYHNAISGPSRS